MSRCAPCNSRGLVIAVAGAVIITVTRPRDFGKLAELGAAAAARRRCAARRGTADRQARARDLAEPAMGLPDRLRHVVAGRADRAARPQGKFCRRRAIAGPAVVRRDRHLQRPERTHACSPPCATDRSRWSHRWSRVYPLVTVLLSAVLLRHVRITLRIVAGTVLTVAGVALVLIG